MEGPNIESNVSEYAVQDKHNDKHNTYYFFKEKSFLLRYFIGLVSGGERHFIFYSAPRLPKFVMVMPLTLLLASLGQFHQDKIGRIICFKLNRHRSRLRVSLFLPGYT